MQKEDSNNQNMQEITVVGELQYKQNSPLPPIYKWEVRDKGVNVNWPGPVLTLLQKDDLKNDVEVFDPESKKIKFNFKVGNDDLGYAIYDYLHGKWQEGHISNILEDDKCMISVANKMEKIINLLGKNDTGYLSEYKRCGNVCKLVTRANCLISDKNKELGSCKAKMPLLLPEFEYRSSYEKTNKTNNEVYTGILI